MKLNPTVILKTIYSANMTFFKNTKKKYTVNRVMVTRYSTAFQLARDLPY